MPMPHMRHRQGDEYYCPRCNTRWGADEPTPTKPCIGGSQSQPLPDDATAEDVVYAALSPYFITYDPSRRRAAETVVKALRFADRLTLPTIKEPPHEH